MKSLRRPSQLFRCAAHSHLPPITRAGKSFILHPSAFILALHPVHIRPPDVLVKLQLHANVQSAVGDPLSQSSNPSAPTPGKSGLLSLESQVRAVRWLLANSQSYASAMTNLTSSRSARKRSDLTNRSVQLHLMPGTLYRG